MSYIPDKIDRKIMHLLQKNARISLKETALKLFMSSPAVSARITRLEEKGILRGYHAEVSPSDLGYPIKAFVNLEVAPRQKDEFIDYIKAASNVVQCDYVTGEYSMLLECYFPSTEELEHFVYSIQHFGRTKTMISMSTPVAYRPVPVLPEDPF